VPILPVCYEPERWRESSLFGTGGPAARTHQAGKFATSPRLLSDGRGLRPKSKLPRRERDLARALSLLQSVETAETAQSVVPFLSFYPSEKPLCKPVSFNEDIDVDAKILIVRTLQVRQIFLNEEIAGFEALFVQIGRDQIVCRIYIIVGASMLEFDRLA
jgi:hypothetical protein